MFQLNYFNKQISQANKEKEQNQLFKEQPLGVPTTACVVPQSIGDSGQETMSD